MKTTSLFITLGLLTTSIGYCQQATLPTAPPSPLPLPATYHLEQLNPAFKMSMADFQKAIKKGQDLAKRGKSIQDIVKDHVQQPVGVKGEKGKSHESWVLCRSLDGFPVVYSAYSAANNYEPSPVAQDTFCRFISFRVSLASVPKVATNAFERNRLASQDDVTVNKFILTDDQGNVIRPQVTQSPIGVLGGVETFSGVAAIPHTDTVTGSATNNSVGSDSNGNSATAFGSATGTATYQWTQLLPYSVDHPYYQALYDVIFPLFDADGNPLLTSNAKSITLHIITPNGEKDVTYKLASPKI